MNENLYDPQNFDGKEEQVIGTHTGLHVSGIELQEGLNTSTNSNYCANCRRNIHCYVKINKETHEAVIHKTCKSEDCECKCKTHYSCRQCGYLHPYGMNVCNRTEPKTKQDAKADAEFTKFMDDWRKEVDSKNHDIPKEKLS